MKMAVIDPDTGLVENVILADPGFALPGKLLVASDTAVPGNLHDPVSGTFHAPAPPPLTLEAMKAHQRAALAAQRHAVETAGIRLGPIAIATDRVSQQMITAAVVAAGRDAGFSTRWKAADGSFHAIDAKAMLAIGTAVAAHVNACFLREAEIADAIDAAPDEATLAAIDITAGWPATS